MPTVDRSDFLAMTCDGYDRTAAAYAERFHHHLDDKPLDLAMLNAFAALVAATPNHRIIDVGCGTGATTAILSRQGVQAFGIDLSPNMISQAQRLNPDLSFCTGSMLDLGFPTPTLVACAPGTPPSTFLTSTWTTFSMNSTES